ncbi:MAG TPA: hypothetical protein VLF89_08375 [Candidatus Saccharimonadales bacterium]|nr:hypothetical protein [Candidatus Saccharimonadales bacterium]
MSKKITGILWSIYLVALAIYWFQIGGAQNVLLRNTVYLFIPFIAVVGGFFSLNIFGTKGFRAKTLLFLSLGLSCWFIGEVLFYYYEFILHINPFPSIADFFYLLAYPLIFFALVNEIRNTKVNLKKIHPSIFFLFCIAALALIFLVFYFGVYLAYDPQEAVLTNLIATWYGVGDLFLIIGNIYVLILAWEFRGGSFSHLWILFFVGFILMLIGDILFAIFTPQYKAEVWFYRSLLDSFWMASYIFFANALFDLGFSLVRAKTELKRVKK